MIEGVHVSDDELMMYFAPGRLAFKAEGAGKTRIFAIPNAVKQALLRPAHDWCMSVLRLIPMDGTFDQISGEEKSESCAPSIYPRLRIAFH